MASNPWSWVTLTVWIGLAHGSKLNESRFTVTHGVDAVEGEQELVVVQVRDGVDVVNGELPGAEPSGPTAPHLAVVVPARTAWPVYEMTAADASASSAVRAHSRR